MRNLILAAAGAMVLSATPAMAQQAQPDGASQPVEETVITETTYETEPAARMVSEPVIQAVPAPVQPASGQYPICGKNQTDGCIQPRAAGKNYGNRPLDYWPGEPASSMKNKPPQQ
ncbi:hypothetical protein GRI39_02230 [Altererythrobacter indicus]|uniref:Uncharacterized protein n=1 Tax=Altericroceibacterium indicum TaxID=374177 RepID=A0A845A6H4_9SPHN|nr:hypothetical protein [Altericroceibacterium indicum]MXP24863.1 hypothetical protein [Altericroceibacterium indicum]